MVGEWIKEKSSLGEKGTCLPNFLEFNFYTFFIAPSTPLPRSPVSITWNTKSDGKCCLDMKRKGDSWEVLQQKQGDITTSRSLKVIYVQEIKKDSGLQLCELLTFFGYTENHYQTDMEVQYTIQTKRDK